MDLDTKARQLMDRRLNALRHLTEQLDTIARSRAELDTKEGQAWSTASRAGWSQKDLADLGLTPPRRARPPRTRRATIDTPQRATHATDGDHELHP